MADESTERRFRVTVDGRDVLGALGAILMLAGAAAFSWAAALFVVGAALAVLAYRLSR